MTIHDDDVENHKLEVETHKLEVETHKLELEARNLEVAHRNDEVRGYSAAVFWGVLAVGAVAFGALVAIFAGYLLGHYTHVRTRTVAGSALTASAASPSAATTAGSALTAGATVNLPAVGKMVPIGAGLTGVSGLTATVWAQGPKNTGDVTAGPQAGHRW